MSDERARITRPIPERDHANRAPTGLFPPRREDSAESEEPRPAEAAADPVTRGVDLGYRVIDDYLRRGARSAEGARSRSGEPGVGLGLGLGGGDFREMTERMFQYFSEAGMIWMEMYGGGLGRRTAASAPATPPTDPAPEPARAAPAPAPSPTTVAIAVASRRPVEVSLQLHAPADPANLRVHDLRSEPGTPRLGGITFEARPEDPLPRLVVRVPDDQPGGTYNGLVLDERSNRPAGTLSVTILDGSP